MITEGRLYTLQDVADLLHVEVETVRLCVENGTLRARCTARCRTLRVSGPDLAKFIDMMLVRPGSSGD